MHKDTIFLHILANTCFLFFDESHPNGCEVVSHCGLDRLWFRLILFTVLSMMLMCRKSSTPYRTGIHGLVKKKKKIVIFLNVTLWWVKWQMLIVMSVHVSQEQASSTVLPCLGSTPEPPRRYEKHWCQILEKVSKNGLGCSLSIRIFKSSQVIPMCSSSWDPELLLFHWVQAQWGFPQRSVGKEATWFDYWVRKIPWRRR